MRTDPKGRKLKEGEYYRVDGRYSYRYTDSVGQRHAVYAKTLAELRTKEKAIQRDIDDKIVTDAVAKRMTVNDLFNRYMSGKELRDSTRQNYMSVWNNLVKDNFGLLKVVDVKQSNVKMFYAKMSKEGYAKNTIKYIHTMLFPSFELAVADDIIRKNPATKCFGDYGKQPVTKNVLTLEQINRLLSFAQESIYNVYVPMITIMIGCSLRVGEITGLTWGDVDMDKREVSINHQLIYKDYGDGYSFHVAAPKTDAGMRIIPMIDSVHTAFTEQKKINAIRGESDVEIDGVSGFIFTTKTGLPFTAAAVNNILKNLIAAYNKQGGEQLPHLSSHSLRHTGCTLMSEQGVDMKVAQYIMGHSNISVTMDVYTHINHERIGNEISKLII